MNTNQQTSQNIVWVDSPDKIQKRNREAVTLLIPVWRNKGDPQKDQQDEPTYVNAKYNRILKRRQERVKLHLDEEKESPQQQKANPFGIIAPFA